MKSKFFLFTIFVFISFTSLDAQTVTDTVHIPTTDIQIMQNVSKSNDTTYSTNSTYAIGRLFPTYPDSSKLTSRSYFIVNLSFIPLNATITQVKVNYGNGSNSYTFKITKLTSISETNTPGNWASIASGTNMDAGIAYVNGNSSFISANLKTHMQSLLSTKSIILGALSESETKNDSYAYLSLSFDITYTRPATQLNFYAQNDLDGAGGGNIGVGVATGATNHSSPYNFPAYEQQQINLLAYDNQYVNGSTWVFNDNEAPLTKSKWDKYIGGVTSLLSNNSSTNITAVTSLNNGTFIAYLKKYVKPTFQNNFVSVGNGGVIKINDTQYNSPAAQDSVIEGNAITATALYHNINNISYYFTNWSTGSTNSTETFYPDGSTTITANFEGLPAKDMGVWFEASNPLAPITIHWDEYPNQYVTQYQIWRKVKYQKQPTSDPQLIAIVNRGTTSFVDGEYRGASAGFTDWLLWYDVRPYYSVEGKYAPDSYNAVFSNGPLAKGLGEMAVSENKIENYPNPFNPETIIRYQIVKSGPVAIKVYDITGREIMTLVNEEKNQGRYEVKFDASKLSSGIYFYRITANGFNDVKKMILMK